MIRRHGLTLIEVLLSSALLATLAVVCVPLVQRALVLLRPMDHCVTHMELERFADTTLAEIDDPHEELEGVELPWPDAPDRPAVSVEIVPASADAHDWIVFSADGTKVFRWVVRPEPEEVLP